jgi:hypothetical protein
LPDICDKKLGWHYIWRGSHVGGGIAAIIGMTRDLFKKWWDEEINTDYWFERYFKWLDGHANPKTGFWQRAFWNRIYKTPTIIDMGGAAHFYWIYNALNHPLPYPEQVICSTLSLQRKDGLYKKYPFCVDLDGDLCVIRSFLQLHDSKKPIYKEQVYQSAERNFNTILRELSEQPLERIYKDSHGLPGALAALTECTKLPQFKYAESVKEWRHPLDRAWWL